MFRVLTSLLLCAVCWFPSAQDPQQFTEVDFRVKGVGLGSSYAAVLRQLGRPVSSKREKIIDAEEVCGPSYTSLRLTYDGVVLELHGDLKGRNFRVVEMDITSPKFIVAPGVRIGMTEAETRSRLGGPPHQERTDSDFRVLYYVTKGNDGGAGLYFRDGRLVKIAWNYTMC